MPARATWTTRHLPTSAACVATGPVMRTGTASRAACRIRTTRSKTAASTARAATPANPFLRVASSLQAGSSQNRRRQAILAHAGILFFRVSSGSGACCTFDPRDLTL